jgi:pimeloyl-ACP methyl ester carboxylesterase
MNKQLSNQKMHNTRTLHKTVTVDGLSIFCRELEILPIRSWYCFTAFLLPLTSTVTLISALADHFHVVTPDYPGFGNSDLPSPDEFNYTFDRLSKIMEDFLKAIGFTRRTMEGRLAFES